METKVSQESLQSHLSFFTTGSSFHATETILATGTIIWKPALSTHFKTGSFGVRVRVRVSLAPVVRVRVRVRALALRSG